jgi:hypothetical protein
LLFAGCARRSDSVSIAIEIPERFRGFFVVVQHRDVNALEREVSASVTVDGFGEFRSGYSGLTLKSVRDTKGMPIGRIDEIKNEEVGYKWICTTSEGEDWFFVGTSGEFEESKSRRKIEIRGHKLYLD